MDRALACMREKCLQVLMGKCDRKSLFENLGVDGRIILKKVLNK